MEVGIIRQFPFNSALQRMAVLCKRIGEEQMHFFCKGSPEMIQSLSRPETGTDWSELNLEMVINDASFWNSASQF